MQGLPTLNLFAFFLLLGLFVGATPSCKAAQAPVVKMWSSVSNGQRQLGRAAPSGACQVHSRKVVRASTKPRASDREALLAAQVETLLFTQKMLVGWLTCMGMLLVW